MRIACHLIAHFLYTAWAMGLQLQYPIVFDFSFFLAGVLFWHLHVVYKVLLYIWIRVSGYISVFTPEGCYRVGSGLRDIYAFYCNSKRNREQHLYVSVCQLEICRNGYYLVIYSFFIHTLIYFKKFTTQNNTFNFEGFFMLQIFDGIKKY